MFFSNNYLTPQPFWEIIHNVSFPCQIKALNNIIKHQRPEEITYISSPRPATSERFLYRPLFLSLIFIILSSGIVHAETYKVIRVYDGDTITALNAGQKQSIRLVGIDTPEKSRKKNEPGQPYSQKATKFLAGMVLNQDVSIQDYGKDRYGRVLGVVYIGQTNVNLELGRNGYAEVYRGKPAPGFDSDPYWQAEAQSKAEKLNIWSLGEDYVSPREWRRKHLWKPSYATFKL